MLVIGHYRVQVKYVIQRTLRNLKIGHILDEKGSKRVYGLRVALDAPLF